MGCEGLSNRIKWARSFRRAGLLWTALALIGPAIAAEPGDPSGYSRDKQFAIQEKKDNRRSGKTVPVAGEAIRVTVKGAILMALENNQALKVERVNPIIQKTFEQQEQAVFDPVLDAEVSGDRERAERIRSGGNTESFVADNLTGNIAVEQLFPSGTTVSAEGDIERLDSSLNDDYFTSARLGLTVTQALLRGFGATVNTVNLRQARLDTYASQYELRGFSEALLSQVETAYWDYALAIRQIKIVEESLVLAEQQKNETEEMIAVGRMAESELVAAQAAMASRRQELIEARSTREISRLRLLRLVNPPGSNPFKRQVIISSRPDLQKIRLDDVDAHVAVAMRMRPDLNQARLGVQSDNLEIVKTKNGLLPKMDFFITLGKTGYADSFGGSMSDITGDNYDVLAGINFEYPLKNRGASARYRRSLLNRDQAEKALKNLSQLIELDVRSAYVEVERARQQISASTVTRQLDQEQLRIETEKVRVGRSTNFLVAQAQRDLLVSQILEVRSVASYLNALTNLYRLEGSLLERRGIKASGRQPPTSISKK
jgi:outer membrane protein TolC